MAKKASTKSDTTVTRIKASDSSAKKSTKTVVPRVKSNKTVVTKSSGRSSRVKLPRFLTSFLGYFKGAWVELRQVHWPTRRATWGLTGAVLAFTAFFVAFILILDAIYKYLFELILK